MKQSRAYPGVTVSAKAERALRAGHPWVYAEEIRGSAGELAPGGITDVFSQKGAWLGAGIYSPSSKIAVRVLSENAKGWTKELNLISWNGREPKYDIREWSPDGSKMGKGVTITKEELYSLKELLMEMELEAPDDEPAL